MALTEHYNLFLHPRAENSGDPGKALNDNFRTIDDTLWDLRTNYADHPQSEIPLGGFSFNKVDEKLYLRIAAGLQVVADFSAGGGGLVLDKESLLAILSGAITQEQLSFDLSEKLNKLDLNLIATANASGAAYQASIQAIDAKTIAVQAANDAAGYKTNAFTSYSNAKTQADNAAAFANTASSKASEAASSAGAAGVSAYNAEQSKISAGIYSDNVNQQALAVNQTKVVVEGYKNQAETAVQTINTSLQQAQIGAQQSSGYAQASLASYNAASAKADEARQYSIAASIASGNAQNAAGQAQTYALSAAVASGNAISAQNSAWISASNASGYAENARVYSVQASGFVEEARYQAQLSVTSASGLQAWMSEESQTRVDEDQAIANAITQLGTTYKGQTTLLQTQGQVINDIQTLYTVKSDIHGNIAGFGLVQSLLPGGEGAYSEFSVLADKFKVVGNSDGTGLPKQIFVVDTETGELAIAGSIRIGGTAAANVAGIDDISYKVEITSDNGHFLRKTDAPTEVLTTLRARVWQGKIEVTDDPSMTANRFQWTRTSPPPYNTTDSAWNARYFSGYKEIPVTSADVNIRATFSCSITEI